ncbi:MAG: hypothetical protein DRH07_10535 [Deltaproteobacteria bacterium]|nr:MAG: hypothetical protein DRH07_10535 [Deltaproteobacteria bacterium]
MSGFAKRLRGRAVLLNWIASLCMFSIAVNDKKQIKVARKLDIFASLVIFKAGGANWVILEPFNRE